MSSGEIQVQVSYEQIGATHVLFHCSGSKLVDIWFLVDLQERSRRTGKSVDQLLENLRKNSVKACRPVK
jgi:hypothetical protein